MAQTAPRSSPPGPAGRAGISPFRVRRDPLGLLVGLQRAHGDVVAFRVGPQRVWLLSDPDLIRELLVARHRETVKGRALQEARRVVGDGLLTSEGERHLRQRRLIQPVFHQERIAGYGAAMVDHADRAVDRWRSGEALDAAAEMQRLALAIVGETLFGADVEAEAPEVGAALTTAFAAFDRYLIPFSGLLRRLPLPVNRRVAAAEARLERVLAGMIDSRRRAPGGDDLLSLLLAARDEDGTGMDDRQVRDEAMTIFIAGHETTALALGWTWALLGRDAGVEARLHEELDRVLDGRPPTVDDLPSLTYTRACVAEAMRLYPPAWVMGRKTTVDVPLGDWLLPAGTVAVASQWIVHRDPRWWPEPERYRPERWLEERGDGPRLAYFPFGAGPRICVGERFAWMEAILLLATIGRRVRLRPAPGEELDPRAMLTLRPRRGLAMVPEARTPVPTGAAA
ncbi:MAG: cytochrome P450 [Thermoleophilia bacterium]